MSQEFSTSGFEPAKEKDSSPAKFSVVGACFLLGAVAWVGMHPAFQPRLLRFYAAVAIVMAVNIGGFFVAGFSAGVTVLRVCLFYGGTLVRVKAGRRLWIVVGWLPLGGYAKFDGETGAAKRADARRGTWQSLPAVLRILLPLSGPGAMLLLSLVTLGPTSAGWASRLVAHQFMILSWHGQKELARTAVSAIDHDSFRVLTGQMALVLGFWNLLPLPMLNGGQSCFEAVQAIFRRQISARNRTLMDVIGLFVLLVIFFTFGCQLLRALFTL